MSAFAKRVIAWQKRDGRHHLPWQVSRDPYCVWLSEIMLQQTQVATVIPYYQKFMAAFPTLADLAHAPLDEVMRHWSGLGYYARARNLHAAANLIVQQHRGKFPRDVTDIHALPGIGRSTAAAISVFSYGETQPILDGNVKRVFARHFGVDGNVKSKLVEENLWRMAERELPAENIVSYTQGLMDLGSLICTRQSPTCLLCPVHASCVAFNAGRIEQLPGKALKKRLPHRQTQMLILLASGEVLLEKRPPRGIWGGLWCLPEVSVGQDARQEAKKRFAVTGRAGRNLDVVEHSFTHFSLTIHPQIVNISKRANVAGESGAIWIALEDAINAALPAPVKKILRSLVAEKISAVAKH